MKRKILTVLLIILGAILISGLTSSFIDPRGYAPAEDPLCLANSRQCVGDFLYGWPFGTHVGYNGDFDVRWVYLVTNILFWAAILTFSLYIIRRALNSRSKSREKIAP